jgi:DNA-binding MarR family transcriptional regulator
MGRRSDPQLLVLHGLRLKGVAEPSAVAEAAGLAVDEVEARLPALAESGLVERRDGLLSGWTLTPEGRKEHERLLAEEADTEAVRPVIEDAYRRFRGLNPGVLDVCSRWQVRDVHGRPVLNDHADPAYDRAVVGDLTALARRARPVCERLGAALERYRPYGPRLGHAVERVRAGDTDYFTAPVMPSFHTVWFELHEDLLATLGLDRSAEADAAEAGADAASRPPDRQGTT